jgi:hypothetical protein
MYSGADYSAAFCSSGERCWNKCADGREDQGGIERLWRYHVGITCPNSAQPAREFLTSNVARPRERENALATMAGDLHGDVSSSAETIEPEPRCIPGQAQSAKTDQPSAQQGSRLYICVNSRNGKAKPLVGNRVFGVAAIDLVSREAGAVAQVFATGQAVGTGPAGPTEPWDTDALPVADALDARPRRDHSADDLVTGD